MSSLTAVVEIDLASPQRYVDVMCEHFGEHDLVVTREGAASRIAFPAGSGILEAASERLLMRAEAEDEASLCLIRLSLASHLAEFARDERPEIVWKGDASDLVVPPNFREVAVKQVVDLTPRMRRVTLTGENLGRFDAFDLHLKLLIPRPGFVSKWPVLGRDGLLIWPEGDTRPDMRTYTIRRIDAAAGEIDVDMVVHAGHGGPGSSLAQRARLGDRVGIVGPGGRNVAPADWYLLAGDETALPAIARILAQLPATARGTALIEVENSAEHLTLPGPPGIELRWLDRDGAAAGTTLLQDAVAAVEIPTNGTVFAWAGAEFSAFRAIRSHWRQVCRLARSEHLCVAYWRRSNAEGKPTDAAKS